MFRWHVERIPEHECWSVFDEAGFCVAANLNKVDADLIAAAPKLYNACEHAARQTPPCPRPEWDTQECACDHCVLELVLSEARGES